MATVPRAVEPPIYDPPITDYPSGQRHSQAWTEYHQSVSDKLSLAKMRQGVTDGSDAEAGDVGEYLSNSGGAVSLTSGATANVVSLDLTAGDWDVSGTATFSAGSGTHNFFGAGIGGLDTFITATFPTTTLNQAISTATRRYNVGGGVTVWVVAEAGFSGTCSASGTIWARRAR